MQKKKKNPCLSVALEKSQAREQRARDGSRRLLRTYVFQPQSIGFSVSCPEDCFAGGKERSLSAPLIWPALRFSPSSRFGVSSQSARLMLSRCAQCDGFLFFGFPDVARPGKRALANAEAGLCSPWNPENPQCRPCVRITKLRVWKRAYGSPDSASLL